MVSAEAGSTRSLGRDFVIAGNQKFLFPGHPERIVVPVGSQVGAWNLLAWSVDFPWTLPAGHPVPSCPEGPAEAKSVEAGRLSWRDVHTVRLAKTMLTQIVTYDDPIKPGSVWDFVAWTLLTHIDDPSSLDVTVVEHINASERPVVEMYRRSAFEDRRSTARVSGEEFTEEFIAGAPNTIPPEEWLSASYLRDHTFNDRMAADVFASLIRTDPVFSGHYGGYRAWLEQKGITVAQEEAVQVHLTNTLSAAIIQKQNG